MSINPLSALEHKSILVIGMAREGLSTVEFLLKNLDQSQIVVSDNKPLDQLDPIWEKLLATHSRLSHHRAPLKSDHHFDYVFKTPGIPHRVLTDVYHLDLNQTQLHSNTQLFFDLISALPQPPLTIGVTGTKGKSTTTSQIFHVLDQNLPHVYLGGNIGVPPLRLLETSRPNDKNIFVLEMSCHQLADLTSSPQIAVVLDISPDHLDYYPTFEAYFQAKTAICRFQKPTDLVLFNQDSTTATRMAKLSPARHLPFSLKNHELIAYIKASGYHLAGDHNLYNTLPAVLIGQELNLTKTQIAAALASFQAVPHRLELVATKNGVRYFDDSASSAPEATVAALKAFAGQEIILIAGGSEKGVEFETLATAINAAQIKHLILFPTTGEKILAAILKQNPDSPLKAAHHVAQNMAEAVTLSHNQAPSGAVVLLSPACASYNMFKNYEDRGDQFKQAVRSLP